MSLLPNLTNWRNRLGYPKAVFWTKLLKICSKSIKQIQTVNQNNLNHQKNDTVNGRYHFPYCVDNRLRKGYNKREQGGRIKAGQPRYMSNDTGTWLGRCHFFMRLITRRMYLTAFGNATTKLAAATKKRMNTITAFKSIKTHSLHFFVNYLIEGWIFRSG